MLEWLLSPIDAGRAHEVSWAVSWHARTMVLGWGILAPLAVLIARFFKVLPGQDWPRELDNQVWWRSHWKGQAVVFVLSFMGLGLVWPIDWAAMNGHSRAGVLVLLGMCVQVGLGVMRGSKGGPAAAGRGGSVRGHHYDMTRWRRLFEALHKTVGYAVLALAVATIMMGLWASNGPVWMWLVLGLWWLALGTAFFVMQSRGMAIDTYQAIWGPGLEHPGNRRPSAGWGMRRPGDSKEESADVRSDRGDRVRSS